MSNWVSVRNRGERCYLTNGRTALTVGSLRERFSIGVGSNQKRSGRLSDANGSLEQKDWWQ